MIGEAAEKLYQRKRYASSIQRVLITRKRFSTFDQLKISSISLGKNRGHIK
jgi:hypothetical protein